MKKSLFISAIMVYVLTLIDFRTLWPIVKQWNLEKLVVRIYSPYIVGYIVAEWFCLAGLIYWASGRIGFSTSGSKLAAAGRKFEDRELAIGMEE